MKFLSKVILSYFVSTYCLFASGNIMGRLDMHDILESTRRLKTLFSYQSIEQCLEKEMSCSFYQDKAYITFGENLSNFGELLQIANTNKKELSGYSIHGKAQKNAYDIFKANEQLMLDYVKSYSVANGISFNDIKFTVEGYSRGTTSAKLAAISVMDNLDVQLVNVLNYSPINIFDQQAADQYNARIGKHNHINFIAYEDFVPPIFTGEKPLKLRLFDYTLEGDFKPVGTDIKFSAYTSSLYCKKVQEKDYLYLTASLHTSIPFYFSAEEWNAHILELYKDMSYVHFRKYKKSYLKDKNKSKI